MFQEDRNEEFIARYSLLKIKGIGPITARQIITKWGSVHALYSLGEVPLKKAIKNPSIRNAIRSKKYFKEAEEEIKRMEAQHIHFLFPSDKEYPILLKNTADCPNILYYKGNPNWNLSHNISIVGTRKATAYGLSITKQCVNNLKQFNTAIISGLAFGIDAQAHFSGVENGLNNFAVLAHGLDSVYPFQHKELAKKILKNGALISEHSTQDTFTRENFLKRNRIIAGMSHSCIVVESKFGGGAITTAKYAFGYDRELYAIPGKITDENSQGCNFLIKTLQAQLLLHPDEIFQWFGSPKPKQMEMFNDLNEESQNILKTIRAKEKIQIDDLAYELDMPSFVLLPKLLDLEFKEFIIALPGKFYSIR